MKLKTIAWLFVLVGLVFLPIFKTQAANSCTSTGTGNWSNPLIWTSCGGTFPGATDSATVLDGHIITIDVDSAATALTINPNSAVGGNGVTITSGKILTISGAVTLSIPTAATTDMTVGGGTLIAGSIAIPGSATANRFATVSVSTGTVTVSGSITFSGTATRARYTSTGASTTNIGGTFGSGGTLTTSSTGTFNFNGSVAQVISAYTTYNNIQINNTSGNVTFGGTTTIGGTLLVNTGTLDMGGISPTITGATTINSTLLVSSITGTKTFGDITIATGGVMNFTAAEVITHLGSLTVNGTGSITGTTGTWAFQKVGGGTISGTASSIAITSATFTTNYTSSIPTTYSGTVTVTGAAVVLTNNSTITVTTSLAGTGQLTQGASSVLNLGGTSAITGLDASVSTNEVHYTSTTGAQTVRGITYHHLFIDKSGQTGTLGAATTVNGNLSITAGTLADGGFQITGNATGAFSVSASATLTLGTTATATSFPTSFTGAHTTLDVASTVNYNSNLAQTISNIATYGKLTTTATSAVTKTAGGALTIVGLFTNGTNNVFADGGFTMTLNDGCTMTGTYTGTGKILLTGGSAPHAIAGAGSYNNVELNDSQGVTQSAVTNISGTLTITSGTWTASNTLAVTGATSIVGSLAISSTTGTKTFSDVTVHTGASIAFSAIEDVAINGNLTVNGTGVISGTAGTLTFQKVGGGTIGGTTTSLTILGGTTFATAYTLPTTFTVNTMTVNAGINETNLGTVTINTALAGTTGTFTQGASTVLNLGGSISIGTLNASVNSNDVHYTSTTASQTVKAATYYNLFLDKPGRTGTMNGTTNILGNFTSTADTTDFITSFVTITGTSDIYGIVKDQNNTGLAIFNGKLTMHSTSSWSGNSAEACLFTFHNGMQYDGGAFVSGNGEFTFASNSQSITGSSAITISKVTVTAVQLTQSNTSSVTIATSLSGTGEFIQGANTILNLGGTSAITTLTASASGNTVNYTGSVAQTVHTSTYQTLDVSGNTNGSVAIAADTTVKTVFALGATKLSTATNALIIGASGTTSRTTGFVIGTIRKEFNTSTTFTYPLGDASGSYDPINLLPSGVTGSASVDGTVTIGDHADTIAGTSLINKDKSVNRYWSLTNNGLSFTSYNADLNFVSGDIDAGTTVTTMSISKKTSGVWALVPSSCSGTSCTATSLTTMSDFQIGKPIDTTAPTGYSVLFDQSSINNSNKTSASFTFAGAEIGASFSYSIDDTNGITPPITGVGTITSTGMQITGINLSSLDDGTITLTVFLTDPDGNIGSNVTTTVTKNTAPTPTPTPTSGGGGGGSLVFDANATPIPTPIATQIVPTTTPSQAPSPIPIPVFPNTGAVVGESARSTRARYIDIKKDGIIDILDFNAMMVHWNNKQCVNEADLNEDCIVDVLDFNLVMVLWGTTYAL